MHILVTNDDGVHAPGLLALAQEIRQIEGAQVTVLAPDHNWSVSGHVKTLHRPLRVSTVELADGSEALSSDGAPSDCVALALLGLVQPKIDLVISGINPVGNLGHDVTYSGTVTAAMEAVIDSVPGIAVSIEVPEGFEGKRDYGPAARIARQAAEQVIAHGLPDNTLLNINVPHFPQQGLNGIRITRQGLRLYRDALLERTDPRGRPYYWIGGDPPSGVSEDGTDIGALSDGYVSITPLQLDLTAHTFIEELRDWNWN